MRADSLYKWQKTNLPLFKMIPLSDKNAYPNVTVIAHWFWNDERFEDDFFSIESSIRITRYFLGNVNIVLVTNKQSVLVDKLAEELNLNVIIKSELNNGLRSLNHDYIVNLHKYFDTKYCLIIQNDGFPISRNLDAFLGRFDYIGAPWDLKKDDFITRVLLHNKTSVGNGGFSLRSHKICSLASSFYKKRYKYLPFCYLTIDDFFYCRVLPTYEKSFHSAIKIADVHEATRFSIENYRLAFENLEMPPLGFHGEHGFSALASRGWLPKFSL